MLLKSKKGSKLVYIKSDERSCNLHSLFVIAFLPSLFILTSDRVSLRKLVKSRFSHTMFMNPVQHYTALARLDFMSLGLWWYMHCICFRSCPWLLLLTGMGSTDDRLCSLY
jgi:hypothetical protein